MWGGNEGNASRELRPIREDGAPCSPRKKPHALPLVLPPLETPRYDPTNKNQPNNTRTTSTMTNKTASCNCDTTEIPAPARPRESVWGRTWPVLLGAAAGTLSSSVVLFGAWLAWLFA